MIYTTQLYIPHFSPCPLNYMSAQYYNIQTIGVAPYDYVEDENATHPDGPPLLHVMVEQYKKWRFDASNDDIHLSHGTHTSELRGKRGVGERMDIDCGPGVEVERREGGVKFEWDQMCKTQPLSSLPNTPYLPAFVFPSLPPHLPPHPFLYGSCPLSLSSTLPISISPSLFLSSLLLFILSS